MKSLRKRTKRTRGYLQSRNRDRCRDQTHGHQRGKGGVDLWAPAGIKQITQKLQYRIRRGNERCDLPAGQFTVKMQPPKKN